MFKFSRVFIAAGVPVGLLAAAVFTAGPDKSWVDFILSAIGSDLVFGFVLGTVAYLFSSGFRASGRNFVALFIVMGFVGVMVGELVFFVGNALPHGHWVRIQNPPEKVMDFTGPTCYGLGNHTVYVRTENGNFYSYDCFAGSQCLWRRVSSVPDQESVDSGFCAPGLRRKYWMPLAPGEIVASYKIDDMGADCGGQTNYILLGDESIWRWSRGSCTLADFVFFFLFAVVSLVSSILSWVSLVILRAKGGWHNRSAQKQ